MIFSFVFGVIFSIFLILNYFLRVYKFWMRTVLRWLLSSCSSVVFDTNATQRSEVLKRSKLFFHYHYDSSPLWRWGSDDPDVWLRAVPELKEYCVFFSTFRCGSRTQRRCVFFSTSSPCSLEIASGFALAMTVVGVVIASEGVKLSKKISSSFQRETRCGGFAWPSVAIP